MLQFLLVGLQSLFVRANAAEDDAVVEDEAGEFPSGFPGGKMPSPQELLAMLDSMTGMSAEEKDSLRKELLKQIPGGGGAGGEAAAQDLPVDEEAASHLVTSMFASQFFILLALLSLITLIFVFFGYKLYKSLSERERKREEKKKNKQLKKKK